MSWCQRIKGSTYMEPGRGLPPQKIMVLFLLLICKKKILQASYIAKHAYICDGDGDESFQDNN